MTSHLQKGGPLWATPDQVAEVILKASRRGGPVVYAPGFWRVILWVIRLLPTQLLHKTKL
jgi:hypothetical protein